MMTTRTRALAFVLLSLALLSSFVVYSASASSSSSGTAVPGKHETRSKILLDSALRHAHLSTEDKHQVNSIIHQIKQLSDSLFKEENSLRAMKIARKNLKHDLGFWWWFKTQDRLKVAEYDMRIRDQERAVDNLKEDVDLHWKQLKPYFGVYSELFVFEMLSFIPYAGLVVLEMIHAVLELGLIALLIGGPALIILLIAISSFFGTLSFIFLGAPLLIASFLWMAHLPFVIVEYGPTFSEFLSVYIPAVIFFGTLALMAIRMTRSNAAYYAPQIGVVRAAPVRHPHSD